MVIPDSDVWIDYFKDRSSQLGRTLELLIEDDKAALVGIVVTEVLRGARTADRQTDIQEMFAGVPYLDMERRSWERAGYLASSLDAQGTPLPLPDVLIAAIAFEGDHEVLTRDKHFERIPGLRLYKPEGDTHA